VTEVFGIELVPAAVSHAATFREAAEALATQPVSAVAVLGDDEAVVGVVGTEALLHGLFPRYLTELRHTAFVRDDTALLAECALEAGAEPVGEHMADPVVAEHDASATHVAELFLHHDFDALPVVKEGRFIGMLGRAEFCRAMIIAGSRIASP